MHSLKRSARLVNGLLFVEIKASCVRSPMLMEISSTHATAPMQSTTSIARSTDRSCSDCLRDRLIVGALDGESWPHRLDENFTRVTSHEYLRRNRQFVHRTWDTLKEQCDVSYTSNKAYIPSTHRIYCNCDLIEKELTYILTKSRRMSQPT